MKTVDFIVVGSGCSGAIAAQTLIETKKHVVMLDVGAKDTKYADLIPNKDYLAIRRTESEQYRYLIGDETEGVTWGGTGKGAQLTPPRAHIAQHVDTFLPVESESFSPLESLGYGGLGIGWGLQCWQFSQREMVAAGLNVGRMREAYEIVAQRIGISASRDEAAAYTLGTLANFQASPRLDRNHQLIYDAYQKKKEWFNNNHIYLGRTPLALLTENMGHRKSYQYRDMDFYSDRDLSAWRPWITIDQLRKNSRFTYISQKFVTRFEEKQGFVEVTCIDVSTQKQVKYQCRSLIIASGALGSGRIVLRSLGSNGTKLPLLCNPYTYIPCVQPRLVGKGTEARKLGFGQLSLFIDKKQENFDLSIATLYSYQSLMLFRAIRDMPLGFADARVLMRYIMSGMVIMGVQHTDWRTAKKYIRLMPDPTTPTGDKLQAHFSLSDAERSRHKVAEDTYIKAVRKLHTYALRRIFPGHGSSVHYAGTLQFSSPYKPFSLDPKGRLHGTRHVYVADSSGFNFLPARGLTFSLMANAHITAENAANA